MKKLAKKLFIGFLLMVTMALSVMAVGCEKEDEVKCEHDYGETATQVIKESTCLEQGESLWVCTKCGEEKTVTTPKKDHSLDEGELTEEATCSKAGIIIYKCMTTDCTYTKTENTEKKPHNRVDVAAVQPTCTEAGTTTYAYCADCKAEIVPKTVLSAIGHKNKTLPEIPANCTENGLTLGLQCELCNEIVRKQIVIPATGHIEVVVKGYAATCGTGLTDGKECGTCGEILVEQQVIPANGVHPATATRDGIAATCTSTGLTEATYCTSCGQTVSGGIEIPMIAHNMANGYCTVCNHHEHSWVIQNAVPVTCTTDGKTMGKYCSTCGEVDTEQTIIPATNHLNADNTYDTYEYGTYVRATCTTNGTTKGLKCSKCNAILFEAQIISATGHKWGNGQAACLNGCGIQHEHNYVNSVCTICSHECTAHNYVNAVCTICSRECTVHNYVNAVCTICSYECTAHNYVNSVCTICSYECEHSWTEVGKYCSKCLADMPASQYLLYETNNEGGCTITGVNISDFKTEQNALYGSYDTLIIPSEYQGMKVTRVSDLAFAQNSISFIKNIIIRDGDGAITLEYGAFSNNENVTMVNLQRSVIFEATNSYAKQFAGLPNLSDIYIAGTKTYTVNDNGAPLEDNGSVFYMSGKNYTLTRQVVVQVVGDELPTLTEDLFMSLREAYSKSSFLLNVPYGVDRNGQYSNELIEKGYDGYFCEVSKLSY